MHHTSHSSRSFCLVLANARSVTAKQQAFVEHDAAGTFRAHNLEHVLEKQALCSAGRVFELCLRSLPLLGAKRRIHQHDIEKRRRADEELIVAGYFGERVAVPDVRLVDLVQQQVGERDRVGIVLLLPSEKGSVRQGFEILRDLDLVAHPAVRLGEKSAGTAAGIIHGLRRSSDRACAPSRGSLRVA